MWVMDMVVLILLARPPYKSLCSSNGVVGGKCFGEDYAGVDLSWSQVFMLEAGRPPGGSRGLVHGPWRLRCDLQAGNGQTRAWGRLCSRVKPLSIVRTSWGGLDVGS